MPWPASSTSWPPTPLPKGRITGPATANYQTNNHQQGYSFQNAGNLNGLNWLARGTRKVAGNYQNRYDGRVYNSGFNEWDANGYVGLNKSWGYSHLTFSTLQPAPGADGGRARPANRPLLEGRAQRRLGAGGSVPVTDADLRGYGLAVPQQQVNHLRVGTRQQLRAGRRTAPG